MEKKVYGLTGPQQNIWNTELFFNDSNVNNVCGSAIINEIIDFDIFKQALNIFVKSNKIIKIICFSYGFVIR